MSDAVSELDNLEQLRHFDRHGLLARAADWAARRDAARPIRQLAPQAREPQPAETTLLCLLPPELVPLGRLAADLSAVTHTGNAVSRVWVYPAVVRLGAHPGAWLAAIPNSTLLRLGPTPSEEELAQLVAAAPAQDLSKIVHGDRHLNAILFDLIHLFSEPAAQAEPPASLALVLDSTLDAAFDSALAALAVESPLAQNPAKQLARRLHERLPIFWSTGRGAQVAALWAMRQQWYAERASFGMRGAEVARLAVLARLPRYWPNAATFVQLAPTLSDAELAASVTQILARRRFPTHSVDPIHLTGTALSEAAQLVYLIELGEWVALYAAYLAHAEPDARTAHAILFEP